MANRPLPRTHPEDEKDIGSRILIRCPFGIEIETTNGGNKSLEVQSMTGFHGVTDGSIRPNTGERALEFISPVFLDDSGLGVIKRLCELGLEANDSCGLHMHLDARDWDWQTLRKFLAFCKMSETEILEVVPQCRYNYTYCSKLRYDTDEMIDADDKHTFMGVLFNLSDSQMQSYLSFKGNKVYSSGKSQVMVAGNAYSGRYDWVNTMSYFYRGSVELRIHEGTTDYKTISNWVLLWQSIVQWIKNHTIADVESLSSVWEIPNEKIVSFYEERRHRLCADYSERLADTTQV